MQLDEIETIMCINYIRSGVQQGENMVEKLGRALTTSSRPWKQDAYMQPVLEDDGHLLHDWSEPLLDEGQSSGTR